VNQVDWLIHNCKFKFFLFFILFTVFKLVIGISNVKGNPAERPFCHINTMVANLIFKWLFNKYSQDKAWES